VAFAFLDLRMNVQLLAHLESEWNFLNNEYLDVELVLQIIIGTHLTVLADLILESLYQGQNENNFHFRFREED